MRTRQGGVVRCFVFRSEPWVSEKISVDYDFGDDFPVLVYSDRWLGWSESPSSTTLTQLWFGSVGQLYDWKLCTITDRSLKHNSVSPRKKTLKIEPLCLSLGRQLLSRLWPFYVSWFCTPSLPSYFLVLSVANDSSIFISFHMVRLPFWLL